MNKGIGYVFGIGMLCGIGSVVYFANKDVRIAMMIFGGIFLCFGLVGIGIAGLNKENRMIVIFPIVGTMIMIGAGISLWGTEALIDQIYEFIPIIVCIVFFGIGIGLIRSVVKKVMLERQRCQVVVQATCVDVIKEYTESLSGERNRVSRPVFRYSYGGREYTQMLSKQLSVGVPRVGREVRLRINEMKPTDIYFETIIQVIIEVMVGLGFCLGALGCLVQYIV